MRRAAWSRPPPMAPRGLQAGADLLVEAAAGLGGGEACREEAAFQDGEFGDLAREGRAPGPAQQAGAAEAGLGLQPFDVAAEPVEIVRDAAGHVAGGAAQRHAGLRGADRGPESRHYPVRAPKHP